MDYDIMTLLSVLKQKYEPEGFVLLGTFGSRARGDFLEDSDIDLLYRLEEPFLNRYPGWAAYRRIAEIRENLAERLGMDVDLVDLDSLGLIGHKHIMPELVYVS